MNKDTLTTEQVVAITATDDVLLAAGPGTGKTLTITQKILWALGYETSDGEDGPIPPCKTPLRFDEIAAVTFTHKAARELETKVRKKIEQSDFTNESHGSLDDAYIGTIHGYCSMLRQKHAIRFDPIVDPTFMLLDEDEAADELGSIISKVIIRSLDAEDPATEELKSFCNGLHQTPNKRGLIQLVRAMMDQIRWQPDTANKVRTPDRTKDWTTPLDDNAQKLTSKLLELAEKALQEWASHRDERNVLDFDDLILKTQSALEGDRGATVLASIRKDLKLLIVDEFQDTDPIQTKLILGIAGEHGVPGPQLFLVGDPKQSIYGFRGADIDVWNEVRTQEIPRRQGRELTLTDNFRSTPSVLELVNDVGTRIIPREYHPKLNSKRNDRQVGQVSYIELLAGLADDRRKEEAQYVTSHIDQLVGNAIVRDKDSDKERPCTYKDIAILYRTSRGTEIIAEALEDKKIPYVMSGGIRGNSLEVLDLTNLLELLQNPLDDLRAFGFLRSPFVSLRDDSIARICFSSSGESLLEQARTFVDNCDSDAIDSRHRIEVEHFGLKQALQVFDIMLAQLGRRPIHEILDWGIDSTGYRNHLCLLEQADQALSNINAFLKVLEDYQDHDLGKFLRLWKRRLADESRRDLTPLQPDNDDVVTLSTIHSAKGLEWPIVCLVHTDKDPERRRRNMITSSPLLVDKELGPFLMPLKSERGDRANLIDQRRSKHEQKEEDRLLYVALTRARDRLLIIGEPETRSDNSYWGKIEPFFRSREDLKELIDPQDVLPEPGLDLDLIDRVSEGPESELVGVIEDPVPNWLTSASRLREEEKQDIDDTLTPEQFTPRASQRPLSSKDRGTVIHWVLERIQDESEVSELLNEAIQSLDNPDIDKALKSDKNYRKSLELEITLVIQSQEWSEYTTGEHYRELQFIDLRNDPEDRESLWRQGYFDLYRTGDKEAIIVDYKTHSVKSREEAERAIEDDFLHIQSEVYKRAAEIVGPAEVRFYFTHLPGEV